MSPWLWVAVIFCALFYMVTLTTPARGPDVCLPLNDGRCMWVSQATAEGVRVRKWQKAQAAVGIDDLLLRLKHQGAEGTGR